MSDLGRAVLVGLGRQLRAHPALSWSPPLLVLATLVERAVRLPPWWDPDPRDLVWLAAISLLVVAQAARGGGGGDAYWRALAPPRAQLAGAWIVHGMGLLAVLAVSAGIPWTPRLGVSAMLLVPLATAAAVAAISAGRAVSAGAWSLLGLVVYGGAVAIATVASVDFAGWPFLAALEARLAVAMVVGIACAFVGEGPYGAWGAGFAGIRPWLLLGAPPVLALAGTVALEAAWPWPAGRMRPAALGADGSVAWIAAQDAPGSPASGRVWVWRDGDFAHVGRAHGVSFGPHGGVALLSNPLLARPGATLVADGVAQRCELAAGVVGAWRADGRAFTVGTHSASHVIDAAGCPAPGEGAPDAWLGDRPVHVYAERRAPGEVAPSQRRPRVVSPRDGPIDLLIELVDDVETEAWWHDVYVDGTFVGAVPDGPGAAFFELEAHGDVLYAAHVASGRTRLNEPPAVLHLFQVTATALVPLAAGGPFALYADGWCDLGADPRCGSLAGEEWPLPPGAEPVDAHHALRHSRLVDLLTGAEREVPPDALWPRRGYAGGGYHDAQGRPVRAVMVGDTLRIVTRTGFVDVAPDGAVRRWTWE